MPETQRPLCAGRARPIVSCEAMMEEFSRLRAQPELIPIERQRAAALLCRQVADEFYPSAQARSIDIEVRTEGLECFADAEKVSRVEQSAEKCRSCGWGRLSW
ncbi:MAG: hypothetical protein ACLT98_15575 [Eggerthellaceae bacterium]